MPAWCHRAIISVVLILALWWWLHMSGHLAEVNHHLGRHRDLLVLAILLISVWGFHRLLRPR